MLKRIFIILSLLLTTNSYAMVVTAQHLATNIGNNILRQGGNAIDAAVAVGYALAVAHPCCGNLGGGGFMLIHLANGNNTVINFRETAPSKSKHKTGIPGTVLGLNTALKRYGTMALSKLIQPAIVLAQHGYRLGYQDVRMLAFANEALYKDNHARKIFFKHGRPLKQGDTLKQYNLAQTLQLISQHGSNAFYNGPIAKQISKTSAIPIKEIAHYKIHTQNPTHCFYRGYNIVTTPRPGGGPILCEILNYAKKYPLQNMGFHSLNSIAIMLKAMRYSYLKTGGWQTTSFSIVDKHGNAVALTYSINNYFGSRIVAGNTGFILNDTLNDFKNRQPLGSHPPSGMAPTMVFKNKKLFLVLGTPGGPTIPSQIAETIQNIIDYNMSLEKAVNAARFYMAWPSQLVYFEPNAFSPQVKKQLQTMGYKLKLGSPYHSPRWGGVAAIMINGKAYGIMDNRRPGGAAM